MLRQTISKAILIALSLLPISSQADYYVRAAVGNNKFYNIHNFDDTTQRSNIAPNYIIGFGVGKAIDDTVKVELLVDHTKVNFRPNFNYTTFYKRYFNLESVTISTLTMNASIDVFKPTDNVSLFIGGGIGVAQINERIRLKWLYLETPGRYNIKRNIGYLPRKTVYNMTHNYTAGVSYRANEQMSFDIGYKYTVLGHTKEETVGTTVINGKFYRSHNVNLGLRYAI